MNFFKYVFSDQPTPPDSPKSVPDSQTSESLDTDSISTPTWSFGGLIQTLATKSESMIETYRKDFQELGAGLKEETAVIREVASRAVRDLPASFEVGASVAQESLETVGQAIDDIGATVWKSTAQIISQGKDSILASDDDNDLDRNQEQSLNLKRYSRFDMQVNAIQRDLNTYCNEVEDKGDYDEWKSGDFNLEDKQLEIDSLISDNKVVKEIYNEVVPSKVDNETFWCRYFYKVHKLKQAEEARALLVKRAISGEEDLSWDFEEEEEDVDDDDDNNNNRKKGKENLNENLGDVDDVEKSDEKAEVKGDNNGESYKDSDVSIVSSHQSLLPDEEDLGWDEIEEINERKGEEGVGSTASASRVDLRKRLIAAEEEVLSWDIDDEHDKK